MSFLTLIFATCVLRANGSTQPACSSYAASGQISGPMNCPTGRCLFSYPLGKCVENSIYDYFLLETPYHDKFYTPSCVQASQENCASAAIQFGSTQAIVVISDASRPNACYRDNTDGLFYFNSHPTGGGNYENRAITWDSRRRVSLGASKEKANHVCKGGRYSWGDMNTNTCPQGFGKIIDLDECKQIVNVFGVNSWFGATQGLVHDITYWPSGCSIHLDPDWNFGLDFKFNVMDDNNYVQCAPLGTIYRSSSSCGWRRRRLDQGFFPVCKQMCLAYTTSATCPSSCTWVGTQCQIRCETSNDCTPGFNCTDHSCEAVACPQNSSGTNIPYLDCSCMPGARKIGQRTLVPVGSDPYYDGACNPEPCPTLSFGDHLLNGCTCDPGYSGNVFALDDSWQTFTVNSGSPMHPQINIAQYDAGTGIVQELSDPLSSNGIEIGSRIVQVAGSAYLQSTLSNYESPGHRRRSPATYTITFSHPKLYNITCAPHVCPENSNGTDILSGCACNAGYSGIIAPKAGAPYHSGSCEPVHCPLNTHGANVPSNCTCNGGFFGLVEPSTTEPFYSIKHPVYQTVIGFCTNVECPVDSEGLNVARGCGCNVGFAGRIVPEIVSPYYSGDCALCEGPYWYAPRTNMSNCSLCGDGSTKSFDGGQCTPCQEGRYSVKSNYTCEPCPAGKYASAGSAECSTCINGKVPSATGGSCVPCLAGRVQNNITKACEACEAGKYSQPGMLSCKECGVDTRVSDDGDNCTGCDNGKYASVGSSVCTACSIGQVSNQMGTGCVCPGELVLDDSGLCADCPEGGVCANGTLQRSQEGFWLASRGTSNITVSCPISDSCLGNNTCAEGYADIACSICDEGWSRAGLECNECNEGNILPFVISAVLLAILVTAYPPWALRKNRVAEAENEAAESGAEADDGGLAEAHENAEGTEMSQPFRTTIMRSTVVVPPAVGSVGGFLSPETSKKIGSMFKKITKPFKVMKMKFKPLMLMAQVITGWNKNFYLTYPMVLKFPELERYHLFIKKLTGFSGWLSFNVGGYLETGGLKCTIGHLNNFTVTVGTPVVLILLLCLSTVITLRLRGTTQRAQFLAQFEEVVTPPFVFFSYLLYASLCSLVVTHLPIEGATFDCTFDELGCRLRADYSIGITDDAYSSLGLVSVWSGFALIVVGVPLAYVIGMLSHLKAIKPARGANETLEQWVERRNESVGDKKQVMAFADLFAHLKPRCWFFEVVNLIRQFILTGLLIMFKTSIQAHLYLSIIVLVGFCLLVFILQPFADSSDTRSHYVCSAALVAMMVSQLVMLPPAPELSADPKAREFETQVIIIVVAVVMSLVGLYVAKTAADGMFSGGSVVEVLQEEAISRSKEAAAEACLSKLEPYMVPWLERHGLEFDDIKEIIVEELDGIESVDDVMDKMNNPDEFISELAGTCRPLVTKMCLAELARSQPLADPILSDNMKSLAETLLQSLASIDDINEKVADPSSILTEVSADGAPMDIKAAVAKLHSDLEWLDQDAECLDVRSMFEEQLSKLIKIADEWAEQLRALAKRENGSQTDPRVGEQIGASEQRRSSSYVSAESEGGDGDQLFGEVAATWSTSHERHGQGEVIASPTNSKRKSRKRVAKTPSAQKEEQRIFPSKSGDSFHPIYEEVELDQKMRVQYIAKAVNCALLQKRTRKKYAAKAEETKDQNGQAAGASATNAQKDTAVPSIAGSLDDVAATEKVLKTTSKRSPRLPTMPDKKERRSSDPSSSAQISLTQISRTNAAAPIIMHAATDGGTPEPTQQRKLQAAANAFSGNAAAPTGQLTDRVINKLIKQRKIVAERIEYV